MSGIESASVDSLGDSKSEDSSATQSHESDSINLNQQSDPKSTSTPQQLLAKQGTSGLGGAQTPEAYDVASFGEQKTTKISYYDPFGVFPEVKNDLVSRLPLVNLHWRQELNKPLRTIASLDVELVQEFSTKDNQIPHQMLGLSDNPYLKIIFIKCEDNENYRSTVRKLIRDWLNKNVLGLRDPVEWLIIHYIPLGSKSYSGNRFRSGVFDKIKTDFNSNSKKDRCIQIVKGAHAGHANGRESIETLEIWSDIISKIKEGVLESLTKRVNIYQNEIEKLESSKNIMGWNFGTFFVMKEALALSFENIKLFDDALLQYDELEQSFMEIMNQRKTTNFLTGVGFDTTEGKEGAEAMSNLLKLGSDKSIRIKIMENTISLFEFNCYLFARQASLLLYISKSSSSQSLSARKIAELYNRLKLFINDLNNLLLSNKKDKCLVAEWSYNVVKQFLKASESLPDGIIKEFSQGKGEMLLLMKRSIELMGIAKGYYIEGVFSDIALEEKDGEVEKKNEENDEENNGEKGTNNEEEYNQLHYINIITNRNADLKSILSSPESFYTSYKELIISTKAQFDTAEKIRIVHRLNTQLALLDYQLKDYESAIRILESIYPIYLREGWDNTSTYLLNIFIKCLREVSKNTPVTSSSVKMPLGGAPAKVIPSAASSLPTAINAAGSQPTQPTNVITTPTHKLLIYSLELLKKNKYLSTNEIQQLITSIDDLSANISLNEEILDSFLSINLPLTSLIHSKENSHGTYIISCHCKSHLKNQPLTFDYATINLTNDKNMKLSFRIDNPIISFDKYTTLEFLSNRFTQGYFFIENIKFFKKKLCLIKKPTSDPLSQFYFYPSPDFLHADLKLSNSFNLSERKICLSIQVKHDIKQLKVRFKPDIPHIKLNVNNGIAQSNGQQIPTKYSQPSLIIENISSNSTVDITVPIIYETETTNIPINVTMDYTTPTSTDSFQHAFSTSVNIGLAIDVNVFDFFRSKKLFSRFSIFCKSPGQPVKIKSVSLEESSHYDTTTPKDPGEIIAFPGNPVSYSFGISRKNNSTDNPSDRLSLFIHHRYLKDECIEIIWDGLQSRLPPSLRKYLLLLKDLLNHVQFQIWSYGMEDKLILNDDLDHLPLISWIADDDKTQIINHIKEICSSYNQESNHSCNFDSITSTLTLPVSIPEIHVVHEVELVLPNEEHFIIGKTISTQLIIKSHQNWRQNIESPINSSIEFSYDVIAPHDTWAVSGKRKSLFKLAEKSDSPITTQPHIDFSIIPLRPGKLPLPKVEITTVNSSVVKAEVEYKNGSQTALVVPELDRLNVSF